MDPIARLSPLLGEWAVEASIAPGLAGTAVFELGLGGAYLIERVDIPHPEAPDALCVIAAQGDAYMQQGDGYRLDFELNYVRARS